MAKKLEVKTRAGELSSDWAKRKGRVIKLNVLHDTALCWKGGDCLPFVYYLRLYFLNIFIDLIF